MPLWNPWSPHSSTHLEDCGSKSWWQPVQSFRFTVPRCQVETCWNLCATRSRLGEQSFALWDHVFLHCCFHKKLKDQVLCAAWWHKEHKEQHDPAMEQVLGARAGVGDCWSFALRVHVGKESLCWQSAEVRLKMLTSRNTARVQGCDWYIERVPETGLDGDQEKEIEGNKNNAIILYHLCFLQEPFTPFSPHARHQDFFTETI